jgi:tRNA nucleotidyltransferase/poly(A) polymerase
MNALDPQHARRFAVAVVRQLRAAGYQALWAGGCVRDSLLGICPKDYDVATNATPEQIRAVFGPRRTLAVGQAFGVITVLGPRTAGQVEVATFRCDAAYSDGRHPDAVTFSTPEEDARRRDFTINGLFFDPVAERVIDYVGGRKDLERRLVRAIGDPLARIAEDKLRMLRAVRIAANFDFALDAGTLAAIRQQAHKLIIVSAERISYELRLMLVHTHRRRAVELLNDAQLLEVILPDLRGLAPDGGRQEGNSRWQRTLAVLERLHDPTFSVALAALLRECVQPEAEIAPEIQRICDRLRLANTERVGVELLLGHEAELRGARRLPWPRLQRLLTHARIAELLCYTHAVALVHDGQTADLDYCREKLALPRQEFDPPPLLTGDDLKAAGVRPGPRYRDLLHAVRDAQLDGRISTPQEALQLALRLNPEQVPPTASAHSPPTA